MKKIFVFAMTMMMGVGAWAAASDFGAVVGFRSQSGDVSISTQSTSSATGFQLGVTSAFNLSGALNFRTGLMYTERPIKVSLVGATDSADIKLTYFDIPATLSYKFEDYASIYGGLILAVNLSNSYSGTGSFANQKVTDAKSMVTPFVIGAAFRFAPQIGADVFFETASGDMAQGLKNYRAVGVNLLYYFD